MSDDKITQERLKLVVQQSGLFLPFFKRYFAWKWVLQNNPPVSLLRKIAQTLAYYDLMPSDDGANMVGEWVDMNYPKRDVLTVLYAMAPKRRRHQVVADSLEIAILRWAGVPLSDADAKALCPLFDSELVSAALDADLDGFMSRPGYSKTRQQVREAYKKATRLTFAENIAKALSRRTSTPDLQNNFLKSFGEWQAWIASLTLEDRIELIAMLDALERKPDT